MLTKSIKLKLRKESKNTLIKMLDNEYNSIMHYIILINEIDKVLKGEKILEEKIKEIDAILHPEIKTEVK